MAMNFESGTSSLIFPCAFRNGRRADSSLIQASSMYTLVTHWSCVSRYFRYQSTSPGSSS